MAASGKSLLKFHVGHSDSLSPTKKKSLMGFTLKNFEPFVHVSVHDENDKSIGKDGEFKTQPQLCKNGVAIWNQSCMFAVHRKPKYRILVRIMDNDEEVCNLSIFMDQINGTADSEPKWYPIGDGARINLQIGWYDVGGALQGQVVKGRQTRLASRAGSIGGPRPIARKSMQITSPIIPDEKTSTTQSTPNLESTQNTSTTTITTTTMTTTMNTTMTTSTLPTTLEEVSEEEEGKSTRLSQNSQSTSTSSTNTTSIPPAAKTQPTLSRTTSFMPRPSKRTARRPGETAGNEDLEFLESLKKKADELTVQVAVYYQLEKKINDAENLMQHMREEHEREVDGVRQSLEAEMEEILAEKEITIDTLVQEKEPQLLELEKIKEQNEKILSTGRDEMTAEVEKIQKEIAQLRETVNSKQDRTERLENVVKKFAEFDDDARELVGGLQQSLTTRTAQEEVKKLQRETRPKGKQHQIANSPNGYAHYLAVDENLELLGQVRQKLSEENGAWIKKFFQAGALENILTAISKIENNRKADIPLQMKEAQLASVLRIAISKFSVLQYLMEEHKDTLKLLVEMIISSRNNLMKAQHLILLAALAIYSSSTHKLVEFCVKITTRNPRPYFSLVKLMKEEKDTSLTTAAMTLINALIIGEKDVGNRIKSRLLLIDAELSAVMEKLREKFPEEKSLLHQFEIFNEVQSRDQDELKSVRYIGNTDLQNPQLIFEKMIQQTDKTGSRAILISLLQNLLLIPEVAEKPKQALYFIERAVRRMLFPDDPTGELKIQDLHDMLIAYYETIGQASFLESPAPFIAPPPGDSQQITGDSLMSEKEEEEARRKAEEESVMGELVPPPRRPMRHLYWKKLPQNKLTQFWLQIHVDLAKLEPMFPLLEEHFYEAGTALVKKPKIEKKPKVEILPIQTANYISIIRTHFGTMSDSDVINRILDVGDDNTSTKGFSAEELLALKKCVPSDEMVETLTKYDGDPQELREAEKFALNLLSIENVAEKLQSLYFREIYPAHVDVVKKRFAAMRNTCEEVLNDEKLQGLLGVILSVNSFLNYNTQPDKSKGIDPAIFTKISQAKAIKKGSYSMTDFLSDFILEHLKELNDLDASFGRIEVASKYQPRISVMTLKEMRNGLERIALELDETLPEKKLGNYAKYFDAMEKFMEKAASKLQEVEEELEGLKQLATDVLTAFGHPTHSPVDTLFGQLHQFSVKWKEKSQKYYEEQRQFDYFVEMGWVHYDENGLLVIEDGEEQKQVPQGILDQLIASVMRGDYGLDIDEDSKRRRYRIVPVKVKPVEEKPSENNSGENPEPNLQSEEPKKPKKVFKFPKPSEGPEDGMELEAKLAARAYKDAELEAEEQARREIEAEERAARASIAAKKAAVAKSPREQKETTSTSPESQSEDAEKTANSEKESATESEDKSEISEKKPKKIVIPKAFDPAKQQEEQEEREKRQQEERLKHPLHPASQDQQPQQKLPPDGEIRQKVSLAEVEALLQNDDFDTLEKLYDDYWG